MIIGWHIVICAYGFWLPNDPRGSGSKYVGSDDIFRVAGHATLVTGRRSHAGDSHDAGARINAKAWLSREPVEFTGLQARAIAMGFGWAAKESDYIIHACSVMSDHAHLVIARHARPVGRIVAHLKGRAMHQLKRDGLDLAGNRSKSEVLSVWSRGHWCVFLDSVTAMTRAICYVKNNPIKDGLRPQNWSFVVPFEGGPRGASTRG